MCHCAMIDEQLLLVWVVSYVASFQHLTLFKAFAPAMQFTFASNAATIVGGCLVTNRYKLRIPAAFISAFVISVSLQYRNAHIHNNYYASINHTSYWLL